MPMDGGKCEGLNASGGLDPHLFGDRFGISGGSPARRPNDPSGRHWGDQTGQGLSARPVAVDGVGDKNTGADNAEERSDCIQHGEDPKSQRIDLTAELATQSKEFRGKPDFENGMRILGNRTDPVRDNFGLAASPVIDAFADQRARRAVSGLFRARLKNLSTVALQSQSDRTRADRL